MQNTDLLLLDLVLAFMFLIYIIILTDKKYKVKVPEQKDSEIQNSPIKD